MRACRPLTSYAAVASEVMPVERVQSRRSSKCSWAVPKSRLWPRKARQGSPNKCTWSKDFLLYRGKQWRGSREVNLLSLPTSHSFSGCSGDHPATQCTGKQQGKSQKMEAGGSKTGEQVVALENCLEHS